MKKVKNIVGRSYYLSAMYHELRLINENRKKDSPPIIIYQMGKVGSTAIKRTLLEKKLNNPIFHVHYLTDSGITHATKTIKSFWGNHYNANSWCLWESDFVRRNVLKNRKKKIISLVREPISRNISSYFYNIEKYFPKFDKKQPSIDRLINVFINEFLEHDYTLNWFDEEMKKAIKFDVYEHEFPIDIGYAIYNSESADILIIKLEKLNQCCENALKEFLGLSNVNLQIANVSTEKSYNKLYKEFLNEISMPLEYVDKCYNSKYMRKFYSDSEIECLRAKWRNE